MLRRVLDGQQQKDPKHRVKAEEHRHDIAMPQPFGVPQIVEKQVAPKGIKQAQHHQNDLQCGFALHTILRFVLSFWFPSRDNMSAAIKRALLPVNLYEEPGPKVSLSCRRPEKGSRVPARKKTVSSSASARDFFMIQYQSEYATWKPQSHSNPIEMKA